MSPTPDADYLASTIGQPLSLAVAEVCCVQPADPIEWLSGWLYKYVESAEWLKFYKREKWEKTVREAQNKRESELKAQKTSEQLGVRISSCNYLATLKGDPYVLWQNAIKAVQAFTGASAVYIAIVNEPVWEPKPESAEDGEEEAGSEATESEGEGGEKMEEDDEKPYESEEEERLAEEERKAEEEAEAAAEAAAAAAAEEAAASAEESGTEGTETDAESEAESTEVGSDKSEAITDTGQGEGEAKVDATKEEKPSEKPPKPPRPVKYQKLVCRYMAASQNNIFMYNKELKRKMGPLTFQVIEKGLPELHIPNVLYRKGVYFFGDLPRLGAYYCAPITFPGTLSSAPRVVGLLCADTLKQESGGSGKPFKASETAFMRDVAKVLAYVMNEDYLASIKDVDTTTPQIIAKIKTEFKEIKEVRKKEVKHAVKEFAKALKARAKAEREKEKEKERKAKEEAKKKKKPEKEARKREREEKRKAGTDAGEEVSEGEEAEEPEEVEESEQEELSEAEETEEEEGTEGGESGSEATASEAGTEGDTEVEAETETVSEVGMEIVGEEEEEPEEPESDPEDWGEDPKEEDDEGEKANEDGESAGTEGSGAETEGEESEVEEDTGEETEIEETDAETEASDSETSGTAADETSEAASEASGETEEGKSDGEESKVLDPEVERIKEIKKAKVEERKLKKKERKSLARQGVRRIKDKEKEVKKLEKTLQKAENGFKEKNVLMEKIYISLSKGDGIVKHHQLLASTVMKHVLELQAVELSRLSCSAFPRRRMYRVLKALLYLFGHKKHVIDDWIGARTLVNPEFILAIKTYDAFQPMDPVRWKTVDSYINGLTGKKLMKESPFAYLGLKWLLRLKKLSKACTHFLDIKSKHEAQAKVMAAANLDKVMAQVDLNVAQEELKKIQEEEKKRLDKVNEEERKEAEEDAAQKAIEDAEEAAKAAAAAAAEAAESSEVETDGGETEGTGTESEVEEE